MLQIVEFLSHASLAYPEGRGDTDFRKYLEDLLTAYTDHVGRQSTGDGTLNRIVPQADQIRTLSREIVEAVSASYEGHPHLAYTHIDNALRAVQSHFLELSGTTAAADWLNPRGLYRARVGDAAKFNRGDLFHIPFEKREKVASQRFSMPGVPCLYLASSVYCCWEELGRPPIDSLQISKLEVVPGRMLSILTIGPEPSFIANGIQMEAAAAGSRSGVAQRMLENAAVYVSVCWPLILACSIPVSKPAMPFVPEYVIPQLVLEWVTSTESIDGLQYPSIVCDRSHVSNEYTTNYVFPAKSGNNLIGYDQALTDTFRITEPLPCGIAKVLVNHDSVINALHSSAADFQLVDGLGMNYSLTEFGSIEILLSQMPTARVG